MSICDEDANDSCDNCTNYTKTTTETMHLWGEENNSMYISLSDINMSIYDEDANDSCDNCNQLHQDYGRNVVLISVP
ncbi:hypothetical protein JTE90_003542 [Oedothorax gibbosus]|uniref:Uncharacterized protein n=1 Tax=Oedothorax gibbosus TaxID=931172 RepID=A0AAV6UP74_9ARAC|nr:hypothetical protein JTE90_003542 [Oedothorax gibbosus]